jgi:hypothetical protein
VQTDFLYIALFMDRIPNLVYLCSFKFHKLIAD